MDIKETSQLNKERQSSEPVKEPLIRTMAKDIAALKGKPIKDLELELKRTVPTPESVKSGDVLGRKAVPPADLPVIESAKKPILKKPILPAKPLKKVKKPEKRPNFFVRLFKKFRRPRKPSIKPVEKKPVPPTLITPPIPDKKMVKKPVPPIKLLERPNFFARLFKKFRRPRKPSIKPVEKKPIEKKLPPRLPPLPVKPVELTKPKILSKPALTREKLKPFGIKRPERQARSVFAVLALVIILIIGGVGGFFYWWNYLRIIPPSVYYQCQENTCVVVEGEGESQCQSDQDCQPTGLIEPSMLKSLIPVAETKVIELSIGQEDLFFNQLKSVVNEQQPENTFRRILLKLVNEQEEKYADLDTLLTALRISLPANIQEVVVEKEIAAENYTFVSYSQASGSRLGLILDLGKSETLVQDLRNWESSIVNDLKSMLLTDEIPVSATQEFQDNFYQWTFIRYMNFSTPDLSLDYGLVDEKLVIATSREAMYAVIDSLFAQ